MLLECYALICLIVLIWSVDRSSWKYIFSWFVRCLMPTLHIFSLFSIKMLPTNDFDLSFLKFALRNSYFIVSIDMNMLIHIRSLTKKVYLILILIRCIIFELQESVSISSLKQIFVFSKLFAWRHTMRQNWIFLKNNIIWKAVWYIE